MMSFFLQTLPLPLLHDRRLPSDIGLYGLPPAIYKPGLPRGHSAHADEQKHIEVAEGHTVPLPYARGGRPSTTLAAGHPPGLTLHLQWRGWGWGPALVMGVRKEMTMTQGLYVTAEFYMLILSANTECV